MSVASTIDRRDEERTSRRSRMSPLPPNAPMSPTAFVGPMSVELDHALGLLRLGEGAYERAFGTLRRVSDLPAAPVCVLVDLVEAAVRCGRRAEADRAAVVFSALAGGVDGALPRGLCARVSALLAPDALAEVKYRESVRLLGDAGDGLALARTRLVYGEWLRRHHRRSDARSHLKLALEVFEAQPSAAFAPRALDELLAASEVARQRQVDTATDLTPRESQVAREASSGRTNREIAARLHLSPATVDYHLRKVFQKLGIASRRELRAVAPPGPTEP